MVSPMVSAARGLFLAVLMRARPGRRPCSPLFYNDRGPLFRRCFAAKPCLFPPVLMARRLSVIVGFTGCDPPGNLRVMSGLMSVTVCFTDMPPGLFSGLFYREPLGITLGLWPARLFAVLPLTGYLLRFYFRNGFRLPSRGPRAYAGGHD